MFDVNSHILSIFTNSHCYFIYQSQLIHFYKILQLHSWLGDERHSCRHALRWICPNLLPTYGWKVRFCHKSFQSLPHYICHACNGYLFCSWFVECFLKKTLFHISFCQQAQCCCLHKVPQHCCSMLFLSFISRERQRSSALISMFLCPRTESEPLQMKLVLWRRFLRSTSLFIVHLICSFLRNKVRRLFLLHILVNQKDLMPTWLLILYSL